ncbi:hypothetical protein [Leifsonia poae]|uniref:Uncharacterized protein n=1 Tax=Leifsonia poae TaxID=110933 RepID=A0A9W6M1Z7_9MICO|nr:hypothetical protein [Leifsonia poae]GLJ78272.1 hypothetical protein GCM10017584_38460 [Leifsonia poae]
MLQNRVVGGATMGARAVPVDESAEATIRPLRRVPEFGPYGYLNLAVTAILIVGLVAAGEAGWLSRDGGVLVGTFAIILAISALSRWTRVHGSDADARFRAGPKNLAYWAQRSGNLGVAVIGVAALVSHYAGLHVLAIALLGVTLGALAGVAPTFFSTPPAAPTAVEQRSETIDVPDDDAIRS